MNDENPYESSHEEDDREAARKGQDDVEFDFAEGFLIGVITALVVMATLL